MKLTLLQIQLDAVKRKRLEQLTFLTDLCDLKKVVTAHIRLRFGKIRFFRDSQRLRGVGGL